MSDYICIDGGTTNTRIRLLQNHEIVDCIQMKIGVSAAHEDMAMFKANLKNAIDTILSRNGLEDKSIERILASGMITSDLGLFPLEHASVPAGIAQLHKNAKEVLFPEISPIPFVFIRGLKTNADAVEKADIMRGEETEMMGILQPDAAGACTYVLPGSHTKVIRTDEDGRIVDFFTTLTGEMVSAIASHTILKNSVDLSDAELDEAYLNAGYELSLKEGLNKALFKVRISDTIFRQDKAAIYSFFLGAILCGDITAILKKARGSIVISGRKQLKDALYMLLKKNCDLDIIRLSQAETDLSVALGAIRVYEYEGR